MAPFVPTQTNQPSATTTGQVVFWTPTLLFGAWLVVTTAWWGAAFFRLPPSAPDWLARAQAICFALTPSGLPETYGWWQLVLAPASLFGALWAVWGGEFRLALGRIVATKRGLGVLLVILLAVAAEGGWIATRVTDGLARQAPPIYPTVPGPLPADYPRAQQPAPELALFDQHGEPFRLARLQGAPVVLAFAYGLCETACPVILARATQGLAQAADTGARLVIVTLDPWRDRVSALPGIAERWGVEKKAILLSGPVPAVEKVLDAYRVPRQRDTLTGEVAHPPLVAIIDPAGKLAYTLSNPSADWIAQALVRVR